MPSGRRRRSATARRRRSPPERAARRFGANRIARPAAGRGATGAQTASDANFEERPWPGRTAARGSAARQAGQPAAVKSTLAPFYRGHFIGVGVDLSSLISSLTRRAASPPSPCRACRTSCARRRSTRDDRSPRRRARRPASAARPGDPGLLQRVGSAGSSLPCFTTHYF